MLEVFKNFQFAQIFYEFKAKLFGLKAFWYSLPGTTQINFVYLKIFDSELCYGTSNFHCTHLTFSQIYLFSSLSGERSEI